MKERWVSPNVITEDEAPLEIAKEAFVHALSGWEVEIADNRAVCVKAKTRRVINVIRFPAMADVVTAGVQDHP